VGKIRRVNDGNCCAAYQEVCPSRPFSGTLFSHFSLFSRSSGLPDNVFDSGERPAKLVQKRVKVGFLTQVNLMLKIYTELLERKGAGRSSNTSPDMPNKRQRLVFAHSSFMRIWADPGSFMPRPYHLFFPCRSSQSTSDMPLKMSSENGFAPSLLPVTESFAPKDRMELRSPQLPFGENVAVATGPVATQ
jgi:poly(A) polymerase